jgi:hypothetical protein
MAGAWLTPGLIAMLSGVSLGDALEVVAEFNDSGGASLGLVVWELGVEEHLVARAWQQAIRLGLLTSAVPDAQGQLWRLTEEGWAAVQGDRTET